MRTRSIQNLPITPLPLRRDHTELMDSGAQKALLIDPGGRARVWCRECHKELSDPVSRSRRLGPECDPEPRTGYDRHDVDQDPIPGL